PALAAQYNPAINRILCGLAEQAREAQADTVRHAERVLAQVELPRAGDTVILDSTELVSAARHVRREVFRLVWRREHWPMGRMTFQAWDRAARLVDGATRALCFPGGITARRVERVIQLKRGRTEMSARRP